MPETLEELITRRRQARGDSTPITQSKDNEPYNLEDVIARRRAAREVESIQAGPPPVDTVRAAKDTEWLDRQQAEQVGLPLEIYRLLKPAGEYAERVQGGYHGLEAPKGSGILAPERIGNIAGTVQDVGAGVMGGAAGALTSPVTGPVGPAVGFGAGSGLSQYARTSGYRPNAGMEAFTTGAIGAIGGPILKGLGVAARGLAPTAARALEHPLASIGGQATLGGLLGGGQEIAQGRDPTDILQGTLTGIATGGFGAKLARSLPGGIGERLQAGDTAREAAAAGIRAPGAPRPTGGGGSPLPPLLSAALPYGRTGRMVRAAARTFGGRYQQGGEENELAATLFDQLQPGEPWTPKLKSGAPLARSPMGPKPPPQELNPRVPGIEPNELTPPVPGALGPAQPQFERGAGPYEDALSPNTLIRSDPTEPSFLDVPRPPAGLAAPELPYSNPETTFPATMKPNILGGRGPLPEPAGSMARSSRFPPNPSTGPIPSAPLETTGVGGIQRFQKPPGATAGIEAHQAAMKAAIRKAARESLETEGPPEGPPPAPPAPPPPPPRQPAGPAPATKAEPKAPEAPQQNVLRNATPDVAPQAPQGAYYEGRGGKVLRVTGSTVETLGPGGKVLSSQEITDRVKGVGGILGSAGARRVRDLARIDEILKAAPEETAPKPKAPEETAPQPKAPEETAPQPKAPESPERLQESEKISEKTTASGVLSEHHKGRQTALSDPYPEDPAKTYGDKFQEAMQRASKEGRVVEIVHQHQGRGRDPTKRGKYFTMRGQVRQGKEDRLTGERTMPHDPESGRWMLDLEEGFDAPEGTNANKFRRSASPYSVDIVRFADTGEAIYHGPPIKGSEGIEHSHRVSEGLKTVAPPAKKEPTQTLSMKARREHIKGSRTGVPIPKEELDRRIVETTAKEEELNIVPEKGDLSFREGIRKALELLSRQGTKLKTTRIMDPENHAVADIEVSYSGPEPRKPYEAPKAIKGPSGLMKSEGKNIPGKVKKVWEDMLTDGTEEKTFQLKPGIKVTIKNQTPKKKPNPMPGETARGESP